jgi:curli production assembly/transport component CsgG
MVKLFHILAIGFFTLALGCAPVFHPFQTEEVKPGVESKVVSKLKNMPAPKEKVVAAVYRFSDQTGQYKPSENVASWSTAVTQGATAILVKAMTNSGWFIPIERENLSNLLNERKIINSTRAQNNDSNALPPLLFAGILLEGGIVGYDTNIITGGAGLRYFGIGGSGQFRKDQVTIYLRAVSTQTGRILKTVHTTKSIISQQLDGGIFRFIDENRILEAEAGYTFNEPPVMAVTEAIDEAVRMLVIEGVEDRLWNPLDQESFSAYTRDFYEDKAKESEVELDYFGLNKNPDLRKGLNASLNFIYGGHKGNYADPLNMAGGGIQLEYFLNPFISITGNGQRSKIGVSQVFSEHYYGFDLNVRTYLTANYPLSPYLGVGGGGIIYERSPVLREGTTLPNGSDWFDNGMYPTLNAQAGLDYRISNNVGLRLGFDYRYLVNEGIDGVELGSVNDQQWNILAGFTFNTNIFKNLDLKQWF